MGDVITQLRNKPVRVNIWTLFEPSFTAEHLFRVRGIPHLLHAHLPLQKSDTFWVRLLQKATIILSSLLPFPLQCGFAVLLLRNWDLSPDPLSLGVSGVLVLWACALRHCDFHDHLLGTPAALRGTLGYFSWWWNISQKKGMPSQQDQPSHLQKTIVDHPGWSECPDGTVTWVTAGESNLKTVQFSPAQSASYTIISKENSCFKPLSVWVSYAAVNSWNTYLPAFLQLEGKHRS